LQSWQVDIGLLMVSLVWGVTFVLVKDATAGIGPLPFIFLRFVVGSACLLPFVLAGARRRAGRRGRPGAPGQPAGPGGPGQPSLLVAGAAVGLAMFTGFVFQTVGLQFTTPAKAAFITGLSVVIVPLISRRVARQAPPAAAWAGVALAAAGMGLLTLRGRLVPEAGDLLVLVCAFAFAFHIAIVGRFAARFDAVALSLAQTGTVATLSGAMAVGLTLAAGPVSGLTVAVAGAGAAGAGAVAGAGGVASAGAGGAGLAALLPLPLPAAVWFALLFTGVLATAGTTLVQTAMQRFTSPTRTALIFATEPVFGALFSRALTGEVMGPQALAGGALIIAGMLLAELLPGRGATRRRAPGG